MTRILCALVIACIALPAVSHAQEISGTVARVVDADTLDIGETRIRLWGVDAPELSTEAGRDAAAWATARWTGQSLTCAQKAAKRSYGRIVARCFRYIRGEGVSDIAFEAVRAGHAVDVPEYSGGFYGGRE